MNAFSVVLEINQLSHQSLWWFPAPVLWTLITPEAFESLLWLICGIVLNCNAHSLQFKFVLVEDVAVCKKI